MSIAKLWSRGEGRRERPSAAVPDGTRVYAIGDIHGQIDQLRDLQSQIVADAASGAPGRRLLVYLGDYVDRGQDSAAVVEHLIAGPPEGFEAVTLKGNHEALLLDFLIAPDAGATWLVNGGKATLASYGIDAEQDDPDDEEWLHGLHRRFVAALPQRHRTFFQGLAISHGEGDYFFAHAGIRPGVALEAQSAEDLIWIRYPFLQSKVDFGKIVVHGHTPDRSPVERDNRIGIDTGAVYGGRLTALVLEGAERRFLQA
ncbi:metallophosphoesterase family protein [Algihabitans albus]|uniref:metallophosphoesterase family protein n=1 Tax=Algihabitans albus TaxID=2164067 RepID=UPI000E5CFCB9|nr:metallophosphoesterase family protein [Algihabitans albus]